MRDLIPIVVEQICGGLVGRNPISMSWNEYRLKKISLIIFCFNFSG